MAGTAPDFRLDLAPPSRATFVWLFILTVALPVAITIVALAYSMASDVPKNLVAGSVRLTWISIVAGSILLTLAIWWLLHRRLHRHALTLHADGIEVVTTFYRAALALDALDLDHARIVDLDERTELKPMLKTNGTGLPGLQSGWFRLRNRHKAFVAIAGSPRVLWIPTRSGYDLLLQPLQPQALLDRLRTLATAPERR